MNQRAQEQSGARKRAYAISGDKLRIALAASLLIEALDPDAPLTQRQRDAARRFAVRCLDDGRSFDL